MNDERRRLVARYESRVLARLAEGEAESRDLKRLATYREWSALETALRRLVRSGRVTRRVKESYDSVSVRWGFGGSAACKRRRAVYALAPR
jgi:DNA-binding HxlR family transcriptional regulator